MTTTPAYDDDALLKQLKKPAGATATTTSGMAAPTGGMGIPPPAPVDPAPTPAPTTPAPAPTPTAPAPTAPAPTPTAPTPSPTPAPAPAPVTGYIMDDNTAVNAAQVYAQNTIGRQLTPAEIDLLKNQPGISGPQGFNMDLAYSLIKQHLGGGSPETLIPGYQPPQLGGSKTGPPGGHVDTTGPVEGMIPGYQPPAPGTSKTGTIDPNVAMNQAQAAFQAKFGRLMTTAEQQQLIQAVGLKPGDPVTQATVDRALAIIAAYGGSPVTPTTPTAPTAPSNPVDPNVAMNQAQAAFQTKFGRLMSAEEQAALMQAVGVTAGQPVTQAMVEQALDFISRYSGNLANPWGPATPTPTTPTTPAPTNPEGTLPSIPSRQQADARLLELLSKSWGSVDPNDPALKGQRDAFELANQRATTRKRAALAERAAARGGLGSGGYDVDTERLLSEEGEANTAFGAQLYATELKDQRDRLTEGIRLATQAGLQQEAQQLQEELAKLDIQLRAMLGRGQLGLGILNSNRQDQQFYDNLGFLLAKLGVDMDNDSIMAILQGGK